MMDGLHSPGPRAQKWSPSCFQLLSSPVFILSCQLRTPGGSRFKSLGKALILGSTCSESHVPLTGPVTEACVRVCVCVFSTIFKIVSSPLGLFYPSGHLPEKCEMGGKQVQ